MTTTKLMMLMLSICTHAETPLTLTAITLSNPQPMMQALVGGGAHLDFRNSQALTAIHRAALNCNRESIKVVTPFHHFRHLSGELSRQCAKFPRVCAIPNQPRYIPSVKVKTYSVRSSSPNPIRESYAWLVGEGTLLSSHEPHFFLF